MSVSASANRAESDDNRAGHNKSGALSATTATLFGPEDLRVITQSMGDLANGMLRVAFGAGGICGSDMHYYRHGRSGDFVVASPLTLGHEIAGTIIETNAPNAGLKPGHRVAINPSRWCSKCEYCQDKRQNLCTDIYFMGSASRTPHMQGGFASYFDVTPAQCVKIPAHVPFSAAALAEPLAVCLHAIARAGKMAGRRALVVGAGPIGLLTLLAAKHAGAKSIAITDIIDLPLRLARDLGADYTINVATSSDELMTLAATHAFDVVFEASGTASGVASAILAVRRGGMVVQIGNLSAGDIKVPLNAVMAKELDFRGSFRFGQEFTDAVELIATGALNVTAIITASYSLEHACQAVRMALDRSKSVKVMLTGPENNEGPV